MRARGVLFGFCSAAALGIAGQTLHATPYASGVQKTGTSVSFILNEPADTLTYSINGGAPVSLDGTTKGTKTFTLGSATDKFSIVAEKNAATGFLVPTGGTLTAVPSTGGVRIDSPLSGTNLISDDGSIFSRYISPRGLDVNKDPNSPYFGTAYVVNSAAGTNTGGNIIGPDSTPATPNVDRTVGDGLYAVKADESDAFGNGDTAVNPLNVDSFPAFATTSGSNSGYRLTIGEGGKLFVTDYSDINGQLFQVDPNISIASGAGVNPTAINIFAGFGGPAPIGTPPDGTGLPVGQNHGSISAVYTTGSIAAGNLVVYAVDEDLNSNHVNGTTGNTPDRNSLWQWNVGSGGDANGANYSAMPTQLTPGSATAIFPAYNVGLIGDFPGGGIIVDMTRGTDGKFYLAENRTDGHQDGLIVTDPAGAVIWDSLAQSRTLVNDPAAADILTGIGGIDLSPDGKYLAIMQIDNDVTLLPLVNGVPDLANRLVMDGGTNTGNGRDIAFDAAGNIYIVTSGQGMYRVYSPGGHTKTTLSFDGSSYAFNSQTIAAGLGGDFNHDNKVDGADFLVWQTTLGDAASLATWKANFGMSAAAAAATGVPEPASLGMLAFAGVLGLAAGRRRSA
jgi:hypothetical protein